MYELAKLLGRPRGESANFFICIPTRIKGTGFSKVVCQRLHGCGLYCGDIYATDAQLLYLSDAQKACAIARMLTTLRSGRPAERRTRNENLGRQIIENIRKSSLEFEQLVRAHALGEQQDLFAGVKFRRVKPTTAYKQVRQTATV